ncbi:MAG: rhomboid family intramembrane serine protease [Armatimonadota bacterium]
MAFPLDIIPLPIRTDRTLRAVPYVTYSLCFLNLLIYLNNLRLSDYQLMQVNLQWGFIISKPSILTLFTHGFHHGDLFHLAGNLLILWLVGTVLEAGIGSVMFLLLYLASMVTAVILYGVIGQVFFPDSLGIPLIGASGAISGVTGYTAFRYFRIRVFTILALRIGFVPIPIPYWLPMWTYALIFAVREVLAGVMEIQGSEQGGVAHWAHIGGLVLGIVAALALNMVQEAKREFALEDSAKAASGKAPQGKSLQELTSLLQENPDDPEVLEAIAGLTLLNGDQQKSRDYYLKAIPRFIAAGDIDRAAINYLNVLRLFPETVLPSREQMVLAGSLERQGHYADAIQAFSLVSQHYAQGDEVPTALLRAAQIHERLGDTVTAADLLNSLITTYPDSSLINLARVRLTNLRKSLR